MTTMRPECESYTGYMPSIPNDAALLLIAKSVFKRRGLIYGHLDGPHNTHCAMGCFFADHPKAIVNSALIDEVAAVNDAMSRNVTPKERWLFVNRWLRIRLKKLGVTP